MSDERGSTPIAKISIAEKFAAIHDQWNPRVVGELERTAGEARQVRGAFIWHHHEHEDELFLVHRGSFRMEFCAIARSSCLPATS